MRLPPNCRAPNRAHPTLFWAKPIYYPSTLANSTLIILFSEMLKFSKLISSNSKNIVKDNSEYLGIFHLLK
jgi:hypothetical protein